MTMVRLFVAVTGRQVVHKRDIDKQSRQHEGFRLSRDESRLSFVKNVSEHRFTRGVAIDGDSVSRAGRVKVP
ncbi:hypothetical protein [Bradyrhizobium sp. CCBAU 53421]|uniref:hypothetical protein n=1 Tax=Bradyrhizobium sp. CCBAU 53421 TaxID=1325120 RepID=UPI00188B180F|nr:hypothetical protein [Bradyrhizobium sp. CCBAU 53421]QOZ36208.1 hypothetical protein XH92_34780 [Bradyrhizobium sp. CCBAU 53421]